VRNLLLATSALAGASVATGLLTPPALAADPIRLEVGGFFKEAYMVVFDDDKEGQLGNEHNTDGFFNDAEVHFTGSTVLDNGLEVGARIELEGETDSDQIDEAWIFFSGGFGEVRIGSDDDALANACIVPPGGTGNFSAFSPNQWGANVFTANNGFAFTSNSVCTGVVGDAQKIIYITPIFAGFQLTASYTPSNDETHLDGVGPHVGMPLNQDQESRHDVAVYLTYTYEGDGWGLTAGAGGSWEGHVEKSSGAVPDRKKASFYQAGINLTFGNFAIGIVGEYYDDASFDSGGDGFLDASLENLNDNDIWVAGIGAAYTMDAWTFGVQYSHKDDDFDVLVAPVGDKLTQDRVVGTVVYAIGPGMQIDGEIGYTWLDDDPERLDGSDDYQALEIGIGTNFTF